LTPYASFLYLTFSYAGTFLASVFYHHRYAFALLMVSRISLAMAHILAIVLRTLLVLGIAVSSARLFAETEYIDLATNKIQDLESSLLEMLGTNPLSVHFAELTLSYGKRYDSVHMLCTVPVPS
jgi:hypothetical protein